MLLLERLGLERGDARALAVAFGYEDSRVDSTVEWLLGQQLVDGGWNCESIRSGSRHGSFHTSITVLEALLAYERGGGSVGVAPAMVAGRQFFLDHRLCRSHRTGDVVDRTFSRFPFPPQWHFDIMRGLEHFRAVGAERDDRLADAVEEVRRARSADGTWPKHRPFSRPVLVRARGPRAEPLVDVAGPACAVVVGRVGPAMTPAPSIIEWRWR